MRHAVPSGFAKESRWDTWRLCSFLLVVFSMSAKAFPAETIVAFGDSTTAPRSIDAANSGRPAGLSTYGLNQSSKANSAHNTVLQVDQSDGHLYVYADRLRDLLTDSPFKLEAVDNEGIGGNRTDQALSRLKSDVLAKTPQTVIVQFGINDSAHDDGPGTASRVALDPAVQTGGDGILGNGNDHRFASRGNYTDNLTQIVKTMQRNGIKVILMTPNQVIDYRSVTNAQLGRYAQAVRDVSSAQGTQLVDVWKMYEDIKRVGGDVQTYLLDRVHPNRAGHQLVADALLDTIAAPK